MGADLHHNYINYKKEKEKKKSITNLARCVGHCVQKLATLFMQTATDGNDKLQYCFSPAPSPCASLITSLSRPGRKTALPPGGGELHSKSLATTKKQ